MCRLEKIREIKSRERNLAFFLLNDFGLPLKNDGGLLFITDFDFICVLVILKVSVIIFVTPFFFFFYTHAE